jgi:phosphatidylserine decarboxylase
MPRIISFLILGICLIIWLLVVYFFRDPERSIQDYPYRVLSPGDGIIKDINTIPENEHLNTDCICIGIFLSVFDVHVQRAPISGEVLFIDHKIGKNHPAYTLEAPMENDQISMGIKTRYGIIVVKQISGILARKCVNYSEPGDQIKLGERYGLIKFGSRVELYLPLKANLTCEVGDRVAGGLSVVAEFPDEGYQDE